MKIYGAGVNEGNGCPVAETAREDTLRMSMRRGWNGKNITLQHRSLITETPQ
jgi:hypothetical protein